MLEIQTEYREGILFARLEGKLIDKTVSIFQQELNYWKNYGISTIVFNVQSLVEIDASGVQAVFDSYQMIHDKSGHGLICGVNNHVNECLKKSKILNYIYEISDELNAIKVMKWNNWS